MAGAGARHRLVFVDRLVATLIHLRHDLPHSVLGLLFGVDRSTITRASNEVRGLLAGRGCAVPDRPGLRLRTFADAFAYAQAESVQLRLDATEVQVRRSSQGPPSGRRHVTPQDHPHRPGRATPRLRELAAECAGMSEDELISLACEFFGWRRSGKGIASACNRTPVTCSRRTS